MSRVVGAKRPGNNVFLEVTETSKRDTYPTFPLCERVSHLLL